MHLHRYDIAINSRRFRIRPFGDLQIGQHGFRKDLWQRWKADAIADKDSYVIGLGDYSDTFRPTIRARLNGVFADDPESGEQLDDMVAAQVQRLAVELTPLKGRIIGLLEGHHFHRYARTGTTSTQHLCDLLKCKYLGELAMIQLAVKRAGSDRDVIELFAAHGRGGSQFSHGDMANLERNIMPFWDADIYLRGHSTKVYTAPGSDLYQLHRKQNGELVIRKKHRILVNTGGFMDGYLEGSSSYVERANMAPAALGWATIEVHYGHSAREIQTTVFVP